MIVRFEYNQKSVSILFKQENITKIVCIRDILKKMLINASPQYSHVSQILQE